MYSSFSLAKKKKDVPLFLPVKIVGIVRDNMLHLEWLELESCLMPLGPVSVSHLKMLNVSSKI